MPACQSTKPTARIERVAYSRPFDATQPAVYAVGTHERLRCSPRGCSGKGTTCRSSPRTGNPQAPELQRAGERGPSPSPAQIPLVPAAPAPVPRSAPDPDGQAASQPSSANQGWWLGRKWTWVAAGSTVLLAAGALVADLSMYSKIDSSKSYPCGPDRYCYSTSDANSINSRMIAAEVLAGLAAAAAVTTGLLFYFEGQPVSVTPVVGGMTGALTKVGF